MSLVSIRSEASNDTTVQAALIHNNQGIDLCVVLQGLRPVECTHGRMQSRLRFESLSKTQSPFLQTLMLYFPSLLCTFDASCLEIISENVRNRSKDTSLVIIFNTCGATASTSTILSHLIIACGAMDYNTYASSGQYIMLAFGVCGITATGGLTTEREASVRLRGALGVRAKYLLTLSLLENQGCDITETESDDESDDESDECSCNTLDDIEKVEMYEHFKVSENHF